MKKTFLAILLSIAVGGGSAYAFLGLDTAPIVTVLGKQLAVLEEALRTANKKLGAIKALKRGFDRIRHYSLRQAKEDFFYSNPHVRNIRREWGTLRGGGDYRSADLRRMPELLDELYSIPGKDRRLPPPSRSLAADGIAKDALVSSQWGRRIQAKALEKQGTEVLKHARRAESPGEASKVQVEAAGLLLQSQGDLVSVQSQSLEVLAAQLEIAATAEYERLSGGEQDHELIHQNVQAMGALR